jgi:hypothetical protein
MTRNSDKKKSWNLKVLALTVFVVRFALHPSLTSCTNNEDSSILCGHGNMLLEDGICLAVLGN